MAQSEELAGYEVCLLPKEKALTFTDHLAAKGIKAFAKPGLSEHWTVFCEKENDVPAAKRELLLFASSPFDNSFTQASWERGERDPGFKIVKPGLFSTLSWDPLSLTSIIEIICVLFFIGQFINEGAMLRFFSLNHMQGIETPLDYYRLLTPVFLHFGLIHIAFNLVMWEALARPVERTFGKTKLFSIFISVALLSNVLQYAMIPVNGVFGGLSGVVYGVIGYMGVISRHPAAPRTLNFPNGLLMVSAIFIVFGFFIDGMANFCHLGGLAIGMLWGFADFRRGKF